MKGSVRRDYVTKVFPITVEDSSKFMSRKSIIKIWFGTKYIICKAKALYQYLDAVAPQIERSNRIEYEETHYFHKVFQYIKKARITRALCEVVHYDVATDLELLQLEQQELENAKNDEQCLNNSFNAYIPRWIPDGTVQKFNDWLQNRTSKRKPKKVVVSKTSDQL